MKYRVLIFLALMAGFANMSYAQSPPLNCTHGSYSLTSAPYTDNGCNNTVVQTNNYNEWCTTTSTTQNGTAAGVQYWTNTSSATGTGQHYCGNFSYVCKPFMYFYEVDGGTQNPDGTYSDSSYNWFYNQAYNTAFSASGYGSGGNPCPETGVWYNGFSQCPTQQCSSSPPPPPPPSCDPSCQPCMDGCTSDPTCCVSPVIIDISGQGFSLTNAANGVSFDIRGTGTPIQMGWTAPGSDNAFLALSGADGLVHNGQATVWQLHTATSISYAQWIRGARCVRPARERGER